MFATGDCVCVAGRVGPACSVCAANYTLANGECVFLAGSMPDRCHNGVRDGLETGVDCGGPTCPVCGGANSGNSRVVWIIVGVVGLVLLLIAAFGYKYWRDLKRITSQRRGKERVRAKPRASLVQVTPLQLGSTTPVQNPTPRTKARLLESPTLKSRVANPPASARVVPRTVTPRASGITVPATSRRVWGGEHDPAAVSAVTRSDSAKRAVGALVHAAGYSGVDKDNGVRPAGAVAAAPRA